MKEKSLLRAVVTCQFHIDGGMCETTRGSVAPGEHRRISQWHAHDSLDGLRLPMEGRLVNAVKVFNPVKVCFWKISHAFLLVPKLLVGSATLYIFI